MLTSGRTLPVSDTRVTETRNTELTVKYASVIFKLFAEEKQKRKRSLGGYTKIYMYMIACTCMYIQILD